MSWHYRRSRAVGAALLATGVSQNKIEAIPTGVKWPAVLPGEQAGAMRHSGGSATAILWSAHGRVHF